MEISEKISKYFIENEAIENLENILRQINYAGGSAKFFGKIIGISIASFLGAAMVSASFGAPEFWIFAVSLFCAFIAGFAYWFVQSYRFEMRKNSIEKNVPDMLMHAAMFPKEMHIQAIIAQISRSDYGPLSEEFGKARAEIILGESIENALEKIKKRNKSKVLSRAVNLLMHAYNSGAEMSDAFREAAEDTLATNAILRERDASNAVQRYTLIAAAAFLVPIILGMVIGMIYGLRGESIIEIGIGMPREQQNAIFDAAVFGTEMYIVEYAIIAAYFLGNLEGRTKNAVLYCAIILPIAVVAHLVARGF